MWRFDGTTATRLGIANPDHRSKVTLKEGQTLRQGLETISMFFERDFVLHRMQLPPGAYYPQIARPADQAPEEPIGSFPVAPKAADDLIASLNQVRALVAMLELIFQSVHPVESNMKCFGASIRNSLILACTECEAQWKSVLRANGYELSNPGTKDYVKLRIPLRLDEYSVSLRHYPWLQPMFPFTGWTATASTQSLSWYGDYNATKHDRATEFHRSTLSAAITAVSAVWVMIAAAYGIQGVREFQDLNRYFAVNTAPRWRYSEVYTFPYRGSNSQAGAVNYPF
ncbi:MAG TPA: hypothetical protein VF636_04865 [Sphingomonas sp.]